MKHLWIALRSGHLGTLISALLYFDVSFMVWVLVGSLGIYISGDLGLSPAQKGLVVAVPAFGGALFRILLGFLSDRFGPKKVGMVSISLVLLPLAWGWLAGNNFHQLLGLGLGLGIAGGSFAVAMPLASRSYPKEHQGTALGIAGAGNSGTVISALLAPRLAEHFGWHAVFGLAMIPVALVLLLFIFVAREPLQPPQPGGRQAFRALLSQPDLWRFSFFYSLTFGGFVGLAGFLAIYLHDQFATPAVLAGTLTALCVFGGSFFRPVGGYLADKVGGARLLFYLFPFIGICFVAASLANSLAIATVLFIAGMVSLGTCNGALFQLVPGRFPREIGVVSGIVGAAGSLGGSLFPLLLGTLRQWTGTYASGFAVFAAIVQLSLVPLYFYHRSRGSSSAMVRPMAASGLDSLPPESTSPHLSWDTGRIRMSPAYVSLSRQ